MVSFLAHVWPAHAQPGGYFQHTAALAELVRSNKRRAEELDPLLKAFMFVIPQACFPIWRFARSSALAA